MTEDGSSSRSPSGSASSLSRRKFLKAMGTAGLAGSIPSAAERVLAGSAGSSPVPAAETPVVRFYRSLDDDQRQRLCFPEDHPLRWRIQNNWAITRPTIGDLRMDQQALCREIFRNLCSEDGYERFTRQMDEDYGGFARYHVALFGQPGTDRPFEWVLTGRHNTLRADGNRESGGALGGPIFYGHAAESRSPVDPRHPGNVWSYQAEQASRIFGALDRDQRARAVVFDRDEVRTQALVGEEPGLPVAALDGSQKALVQQLLRDLTRPFRDVDAAEIPRRIHEAGGTDALRLTFYREEPHAADREWDIWKLEGPAFAWYFHGTPHVHAWINFARHS